MLNSISKEEFEKYMKVINTGKYNAITDAKEASSEAGLSLEKWFEIIKTFDLLVEEWPEVYDR